MKKLIVIIALVMSVATLAKADNLPTNGTDNQVLYWNATATTGSNATWGDLQSLVTNNSIFIPASVGSGVNGATPDTVGNLNFVGTGLTSSVSGSGSTATSNVDFSNLSTTEGQTNATNITNLTSTVNGNSTNISSLQSTVNTHTTQINQNTSDISSLNTTVADHSIHLTNLDNGLAQEVTDRTNGDANLQSQVDNHSTLISNNATAITNETTRATGAEGALQTGLNNEAATRASADQALQNQINNVNAQAQDNTNRIDRLEQTKYLLEPVVRLYDDKRWQVQAFDSYDVRHGMNAALGMRVMFKLGKSYEEKLLAKTNPEIARLLSANVSHDIAERDAIRKQLAEDRALIAEQSALLKQLAPQLVVLSANVSKVSDSKVLSSKDEDLLQALDGKNEAFASK